MEKFLNSDFVSQMKIILKWKLIRYTIYIGCCFQKLHVYIHKYLLFEKSFVFCNILQESGILIMGV